MVSMAVVHHPSRTADAERLLSRAPNVRVFVDDQGRGMTHTSRRAWFAGLEHPTADWHLVMEDDVLPCVDFEHVLDDALKRIPFPVAAVSLFGISQKLREAYDNGKSWVMSSRVNWAQALVVHRTNIEPFLHFEGTAEFDNPYWCQRLSDYAEASGFPIATTVPTLVQHVGHDRSLIGNPTKAGGQHARVSPVFWDDVPHRPWTKRAA